MDPLVVLTRAYKRGACWYVEGRVNKGRGWMSAAFTAHAPDVEHMTRAEFEAFAIRQLPNVTEDNDWEQLHQEALVS